MLIFTSWTLIQGSHLDLAFDKYQQGLYFEAINLAEKELKANPRNVNALKLIGKSYFAVNDFDNATITLEKARNLAPEDSEVNQLFDKVYQATRKQLESTINQYRNYLIRHPEDNNYRLKLARAYKEIGDFTKAQTEYEIYLENNPKDKIIEQEYLSIFPNPSPKKKSMKAGHPYKSKGKCVAKSIKSKTKNKNLSLTKVLDQARDLVGKEKYPEAESLYEIYLAKKPCDTTVLKEYAQALSWNKQYDKSIIAYQKLLILNPHDKIAAYELAQVLSWAEKYDEAIAIYQTLDKTDIKILTGLAQTYHWKGDYRNARITYQKILVLDPDNSEAKKIISELKQIEIPGPEFRAIANNFWDSEEFYYKNFTAALNFHLSKKTSLEPGFSARRFEQLNDIITCYSYSIQLVEQFSEEADGGIHYAYNYYDDVPNTHSYGLILNYVPNLLTNLTFSYDHHDIIYDVSTTRSLIQGITTDNFEVAGSHQFEKGYGLIGNYLYGLYSDDNQLQNLQARLYYQLFKILRIGYAYNLITYSEVSPWYWSPDFYQTHSIWFELANGSESPLSYYVGAEIAKVTNSSKLSRAITADISFNPSDRFSLGFQFSYSELSRTKDAPAYWQQSLAAYLRFKL